MAVSFSLDRLIESTPRIRAPRIGTVGGQPGTHEALVNGIAIRLVCDTWRRSWFECPKCGRRRRHLYLLEELACRTCLGLDYSSWHLSRWAPGIRSVIRLRRQLAKYGVDPRPFGAIPRIPRGRNRIHQIIREILSGEAIVLGNVRQFTQKQLRRDQRKLKFSVNTKGARWIMETMSL